MSTAESRSKLKEKEAPQGKDSKPKKKAVKSTPATDVLALAGLPYAIHISYRDAQDPNSESERVENLGMDRRRVFETIITQAGDDLVAVSIPVLSVINLAALASAIGHHHAKILTPEQATQISGCDSSCTSPLGLPQTLSAVIDISAMTFPSIIVPSGLPGMNLEIASEDLINVLEARTAPVARF